MKTLYIIGNGFDIHHGINSKYRDFHNWLEENDNSTFAKLSTIYETCACDWWNNFEQNLSRVSFDYINKISSENALVYGSEDWTDADYHSAAFEVEFDMAPLLESIKQSLISWIHSLNKANRGKMRIEDDGKSFFITFNYTKTLEEVYNIPEKQIWHIHGCIDDEDLVIGHEKTSDEIYSSLKGKEVLPSKGISDEQFDDWQEYHTDDPITQSVIDASSYYIGKIKKNVENIITQHQMLFETLKNVEKIYILGFSFSPIDLPYMEEILKYINKDKVIWVVSSYSSHDNRAISDFIIKHSLDNRLWRIIKMETLNECKEQKIDFKM